MFDAVGEPATLAQRWITWRAEFELYVTASGISDLTQKRALLLHLANPEPEISSTARLLLMFAAEPKTMTKPWRAYQNTSSSERTLQWQIRTF